MSFHYALIIGILLFLTLNYITDIDYKKILSNKYFLIISIGLLVRIVSSIVFVGMENDLDAMKSISLFMAENSTTEVYSHFELGSFPPLNLFILYILGGFSSLIGLNYDSYVLALLLKLPAILADIAIGVLIYRISYKNMRTNQGFLISILFVLNPLSILMSSVWGLYDSIFMFFFILSLERFQDINDENIFIGFLFYTVSVMSKPRALIFLPIYIFVLANYLFKVKSEKTAKTIISIIVTTISVVFVTVLPFMKSIDFDMIVYSVTNKGMDFLTINAYNMYGFFRGNWSEVGEFTLISYNTVSILFFAIIFSISRYLLYKTKNKGKFFLSASIIAIGIFMFTIRIHEKHFYIGIIFLLMAFIYTQEKFLLLLYTVFSGINLINCIDAIKFATDDTYPAIEKSIYILSLLSLVLVIIFIVYVFKYSMDKGQNQPIIIERRSEPFVNIDYKDVVIEKSQVFEKLDKNDYKLMLGITIIYAIIAFARLGDMYGPYTYAIIPSDEEFVIELEAPSKIKKVQYLPGPTRNNGCEFYFSQDGVEWTTPYKREIDGAFKWDEFIYDNNNIEYSFVKFKNYSDGVSGVNFTTLAEVAFRGNNDEIIGIKNYPVEYSNFFDEQDVVPLEPNYYNSAIFDEVYYNQTVANFMNKEQIFETTHPHLGKYIMILGVKIFGFNPFGWRFMGTLFGVLMVPVVYIFSKKMFGKSNWALFTSIIFAFDFMHFVQTRLATIDTYPTFFIMLMFLFMYKYYKSSFYDKNLKSTLLPLFLSGLFMGIGFAAKWPTAYGGVGLAIIFFYTIYKRFIEALKINDVYNEYLIVEEIEHVMCQEEVLQADFRKVVNYMESKDLDTSHLEKDNLSEYIMPIINEKKLIKNDIEKEGFKLESATKVFFEKAIKTCLACVLFFVIIPTIIYFAAYIPNYNIEQDKLNFINNYYETNYVTLDRALEEEKDPGIVNFVLYNQRNMFDFHSQLNDEHPYSAFWWEWLINLRPILYHTPHSTRDMGNKTEVVSAFGNPAVWWVGLAGLMFCFGIVAKTKNKYTNLNKNVFFLLVAYLSQLLPWTLVTTRTTFIYHYFPCIIFLVLMITVLFKEYLHDRIPKMTYAYVALVVLLFILFYPALAALVVPREYILTFLKWFPSWWLA